jgi:hypothetical protein
VGLARGAEAVASTSMAENITVTVKLGAGAPFKPERARAARFVCTDTAKF